LDLLKSPSSDRFLPETTGRWRVRTDHERLPITRQEPKPSGSSGPAASWNPIRTSESV